MLKIYGVDADKRKSAIEKVIALDCVGIAKELWGRFVNRLDNDVNK